jgi:hypothetical protein
MILPPIVIFDRREEGKDSIVAFRKRWIEY